MKTETAVAAMDVATVEESLAIAKLEYEKAKAELDIRSIRSPIDGVVTERRLSAGELVREKPIMVIAKTDPLHAEVSLPVSAISALIVPGTKAEIMFSVPGLPTREATAGLVDRFIDAASNTFGVRFVLPNPDNEIPAGHQMSGQVSRCRNVVAAECAEPLSDVAGAHPPKSSDFTAYFNTLRAMQSRHTQDYLVHGWRSTVQAPGVCPKLGSNWGLSVPVVVGFVRKWGGASAFRSVRAHARRHPVRIDRRIAAELQPGVRRWCIAARTV